MNDPLSPGTPQSFTADSLLWKALPELTLNIAQTAALCGISVRQLGYWTRQGYVQAQGQGARRTYGLDAMRRILAIRQAMSAGFSLRQVSSQSSSPAPLSPAPLSPAPLSPAPSVPAADAERTSSALRAFFFRNRHARDHAGGLAVKMGRAEEDIRAAAEQLCAAGVLVKTLCQGLPVFRQAEEGPLHA